MIYIESANNFILRELAQHDFEPDAFVGQIDREAAATIIASKRLRLKLDMIIQAVEEDMQRSDFDMQKSFKYAYKNVAKGD